MKKFTYFFKLCLVLLVAFNAYGISQFQAGEIPPKDKIKLVLSAGNPTDVLLLAVAPEKLAGLSSFNMQSAKGELFAEHLRQLPTLGKIAGKGSTLSAEKIIALQPDLIVDVGNITANYQDQAKRTFAQTQVPYLLVDGSLANTPNLLRQLGQLLGNQELSEQQAIYAEQTLQQAKEFAVQHSYSAYLARGIDGLQTGQNGSIHTQAMEWVGLRNVAEGEHQGLTQVSLEQLLLWQPDFIFTQFANLYTTMKTSPQWQALTAVAEGKVFLIPDSPFGWIDSPPSLNRLLGIRWLQHLLLNKPQADFIPEVQKFYQLFYHIELSSSQAEQLLQ